MSWKRLNLRLCLEVLEGNEVEWLIMKWLQMKLDEDVKVYHFIVWKWGNWRSSQVPQIGGFIWDYGLGYDP